MDDWKTLSGDAPMVAKRLLGCELERTFESATIRFRIVETEAYGQTDAASHSYSGRTPRTDVMFGPAGYMYVYFTYGMHYCMNVVCGPAGVGSAVLLRAVEPLEESRILRQNRNGKVGVEQTNGPAKLCQALAINREFNGHDMREVPCKLIFRPQLQDADIVQTTRIGISKAVDAKYRFYIRSNDYISKT